MSYFSIWSFTPNGNLPASAGSGLVIDGTQHNIRLNLNFRVPRLSFQTISPTPKSGGLEDGHHFPLALEKTFVGGVTDLFVFDGELASTIISEKATDAEKLIRSLYHLDMLTELQGDIQKEIDMKKRASKLTQASTQSHVSKLQKEHDAVKAAHKLLKNSERSLNADLGEYRKSIDALEHQLKTFAHDKYQFEADQRAITMEFEKLEPQTNEQCGNMLRLFRTPPQVNTAIRRHLDSLSSTLETHKLPRSLSSDFFNELAHAKKCVCGRPIAEHEKSEILEHMDDYLAIDEIAVINHMRSRLQSISDVSETYSIEAIKLKNTLAEKRLLDQRLRIPGTSAR